MVQTSAEVDATRKKEGRVRANSGCDGRDRR